MKILTRIQERFRRLGNRESKLISGEQPLVVFISSVMNNELSWARNQATERILGLSGFIPWAFEYTPASSEDAKDGYLRKVRESDLVIWLVGASTTKPVASEIREALSANRRLLVFLLPTENRDETTEALKEEVGTRAKWTTVNTQSEFSDVLEKTISDEIIRALRNKPGMGRLAILNELISTSRARCLARWRATGLPLNEAINLYEDISVGMPPTKLLDLLAQKSLVVLIGDYGAGKSLITERVLQASINESINDLSSPIPIYLESQEAIKGLERCINTHSNGIGNPRIQGATVIIDGADEVGISASVQLLNQARILSQAWPNMSVIISSRALPGLAEAEEIFRIGKLSEQEVQNLVARVAKTDISSGMFHSLPMSIRDAVSRPFFALLWGNYLRNRKDRFPETTGQLIDYLVEKSISYADEKVGKTLEFLEIIGAKSVDNRGGYILWRDVCGAEDLDELIETRLVEKIGDRIGFPLPILAQWFAAHSLVNNIADIKQIATDIPRLDRWFYPLVIIVSLFPFEKVTEILSPVIANNPALSGEIIEEATRNFGEETQTQVPSATEAAEKIRTAFQIWIKGLGILAEYIAPVSDNKELSSTGVIISDNRLAVSWYLGKHKDGDIVELPVGYFGKSNVDRNWRGFKSMKLGAQSAWAWRWSFDDLVNELNNLIRKQAFMVDKGHIYTEKMWEYALKAMKYGSLYSKHISLEMLAPLVQAQIERYGDSRNTFWNELYKHIKELHNNHKSELMPPWPGPDLVTERGGWVWSPYTDEQILRRAQEVYSAALVEYTMLTDIFFKSLKPRMLIATLLPAKMVGEIHFSVSHFGGRTPGLNWHFEPLLTEDQSYIEFSLNEIDKAKEKIRDVSRLHELNRKMRPQASEWISSFASYGILDIFNLNPVTKIVYGWLRDDLSNIKWASRI